MWVRQRSVPRHRSRHVLPKLWELADGVLTDMATPLKPRALKLQRPMPPADIGQFQEGAAWPVDFMPAPEVRDWMHRVLVAETGALHNPEHRHLDGADLEVMWAASGFEKAGRFVTGQAEQVAFRSSGWQKRRQEQQMFQWFGRVPGFLITLDAQFSAACSDAQFCALLEHEMYHVAHATDKHGAPTFNRETGKPKLNIRGHDVEEFVGVIRRYGTGPSIQPIAALVAAANADPEIADAAIAGVCGTCLAAAA